MNNQQTDCECDTTPQAPLSIDEALELLLNSAKVTRSSSCITTVLAPFGIGAPVNSRAAQPDANVFPVLPAGMRSVILNVVPPELSIDEALELLLNSAKVTRSTQWLGLDNALNKILAVDLYADIFVPSFDKVVCLWIK
jgi:hypothetical protein